MQKTAQRRGILNKLKEKTNISGHIAEKYFQPELLRVMNSLRTSDNDIRSVILGKSYDGGDPGANPISLKSLLKSAKTNLNRREYMNAVTDLGNFHKKLSEISKSIGKLNFDVNKIHHQFLFQGLDKQPDRKEQLKDLHNRWAQQERDFLIKQAGIGDFLVNTFSRRGRALAVWEKKYPKKMAQLKEQSLNILNQSQVMFESLLESLKVLATARAERSVDAYVAEASNIVKNYQKYDNNFKTYYTGVVKPLVDEAEIFIDKQPVENPKELGKQDIGVTPTPSSGPSSPAPAASVPELKTMPPVPELNLPSTQAPAQQIGQSFPAAQAVPLPDDSNSNLPHDTEPHIRVAPDQKVRVAAHAKFMSSLESMSEESPAILAAYIKKYARAIEEIDLETSIKLFGIAKSIKG